MLTEYCLAPTTVIAKQDQELLRTQLNTLTHFSSAIHYQIFRVIREVVVDDNIR